jgi:hypothetical protein
MMKVNSKVMVTTVPPCRPLAYTRRPIFVSASVQLQIYNINFLTLKDKNLPYFIEINGFCNTVLTAGMTVVQGKDFAISFTPLTWCITNYIP